MAPDRVSSDPAFLAAYGNAIQEMRTEMGFDRRGLADQAGISYSYLSAIESGQAFPSATMQTALAETLGTTAAELLARANGALTGQDFPSADSEQAMIAVEPRSLRMSISDTDSAFSPAMRPAEPIRSPDEGGVSASGALAELQVLIPSLTPEDAAVVVSTARRLAASTPPQPPTLRARYRDDSLDQAPRTEQYLRFWAIYLEELDRQGLDWAHGRTPEPRSYLTTGSPIRGTSLSASFARNRMLRHELYINRGSRTANLELLHELEANRDAIEAVYGHRLEFEDPGRERRAVRIAEYREGHITDVDEWADYIDWFIDRGTRMRRVLMAYLKTA